MPLTMYTTTWCGFCKNLKRQLGRAGIEVTEVDIELDPAAAEFVMSVNGGNQTVPTLLFADGSTMCNPSAAQVQKKLAQLGQHDELGNQGKIDYLERALGSPPPPTNLFTNGIRGLWRCTDSVLLVAGGSQSGEGGTGMSENGANDAWADR